MTDTTSLPAPQTELFTFESTGGRLCVLFRLRRGEMGVAA
jgi:hypothetical protein